MKARTAGRDLDVALLGPLLERDLTRGQAANHVRKQAAGHEHAALALGLRVCKRARDGQLHIGRAQRQLVLLDDEQDATQGGQRTAGRGRAADELKRAGKGVARYG